MKADRCDVKDCPILLGDDKGFELTTTVYVLDRTDRDADAVTVHRHACSHNHAKALLAQPAPKLEAFLVAFTPEGKTKRRGPTR